MRKLTSIFLLATLLLITVSFAQSQQLNRIAKIGFLGVRPDDRNGTFELLRRELKMIGYVDGRSIAFEYRNAENKLDRLPALVRELIRLKVDIPVVAATNEARAAKSATKTIPIVGLNLGDPVASGLVDSFARPTGNLTGFTPNPRELGGKRLELLKETIPKLLRLAVLWDPNAPTGEATWKEIHSAANTLGLQAYSMEVSKAEKLEIAFKEAVMAGSGALTVNLSPMINSNQRRIADAHGKVSAAGDLSALRIRPERRLDILWIRAHRRL